MAIRNAREGWGFPARLLHWAAALLILFMSGLGLYMTNAFPPGDMASYSWYQMHKSWGFVFFCLLALRIVWRLVNPTPALPERMPAFERLAAHAGHIALYLLMIGIPLTGWLMISASPLQDLGIPNKVFGAFDFPDPFVPGDAAIADWMKELHETLWLALVVVVAVHVLAALKHHFIDRDTVLRRMVRGR